MRTIKFRAWYEDEKTMAFDDKDIPSDVNYWDGVESSVIGLINYRLNCSRGIIFMQFTGLLDKNGKEIWEGDVVRETKEHWCSKNTSLHVRTGVIEYNVLLGGKFWAKDLESVECNSIGLHDLDEDGFEVVGNIYENPELLK